MRKFANFSWKGCEIIQPANWAGFERIMYSSGIKFASLVLIKFFEFAKVTNINSKHWTKCLKICRVSILKIAADALMKLLMKVNTRLLFRFSFSCHSCSAYHFLSCIKWLFKFIVIYHFGFSFSQQTFIYFLSFVVFFPFA